MTDAPHLHEAVRQYGEWRTGAAGFSQRTWDGERPGLMAFADYASVYGITTLAGLTDEFAEDWWKDVRASVGNTTAPVRLSQARSFLGWAVKKGWLDEDPTLLLRAAGVPPRLRDRVTASELVQMIEYADYPQHRLILALAGNLALRQSEIKSLRIHDVNLAAGTIRVTVHKTKVIDDMPLTEELTSELDRWLRHYRANGPRPLRVMDFLVPAQRVDGINNRVTYNPERSVGEPEDVVKRALSKLGWVDTTGEGIHTIRRSMARLYFDAAEAEESYHEALLGTMRLLHHDRAETTLRYIGVDRQTQARDKFLKGKPFLSRLAAAERTSLRVVS